MPNLKTSQYNSSQHFVPTIVPKTDYFELVYKKILDSTGCVKQVQEKVSMPHPTLDLDSNHFRLDVVLETDPSQLQKVDFVITDNFKVLDNLSLLNNTLNEKSKL